MEAIGQRVVEFRQSQFYQSTKQFYDQSMAKVQEILKPVFDSGAFQQGKKFCLKHWAEPIPTSPGANSDWYIQQEYDESSAENTLIGEYLCERATGDRYNNEPRFKVAYKTFYVAFVHLCYSPFMFICDFGKGIYKGVPVAGGIVQEYRIESRKREFNASTFFNDRVERLKPAGRYLLEAGIDCFAAYVFLYYFPYTIGAISAYCFYNPLQARVTVNAAERLWHSQAEKVNWETIGPFTLLELFPQGSLLFSDFCCLRKLNEEDSDKKEA